MKFSLFQPAVLLLGLTLTACSSSATTVATKNSTYAAPPSTSAKLAPGEHFPGSNSNPRAFGYSASASVTRQVSAMVEGFYRAAAKDDGVRACALLYRPLAVSVAEDYGHSTALPNIHGKSCPVVMGKLFRHLPGQPAAVLAETHVTGVRVYKDDGYALLHSSGMPNGVLSIAREDGIWRPQWIIGKEPDAPKAGSY